MLRYLMALALLSSFLFFGTSIATANEASPTRQIELQVEGMVCTSCVEKVKSTLMEQPGVETVSVDLETGKVLVSMSENATLDVATTDQLIKEAGYAVKSVHPTAPSAASGEENTPKEEDD